MLKMSFYVISWSNKNIVGFEIGKHRQAFLSMNSIKRGRKLCGEEFKKLAKIFTKYHFINKSRVSQINNLLDLKRRYK